MTISPLPGWPPAGRQGTGSGPSACPPAPPRAPHTRSPTDPGGARAESGPLVRSGPSSVSLPRVLTERARPGCSLAGVEPLIQILVGAAVVALVIASSYASRRGPRGQRVAKFIRRTLTVAVVGLVALIAAFFLLLVVLQPIPF
jgi:hypothetical protein